ncbi:thiol protease aleurain isoform X2 [Coffea arabica]|nr:thiol protease aleurain-like isoform X2 [Coffea arabica]
MAKPNPFMSKRKLSDADDDPFAGAKKRKISIFSSSFFKNVTHTCYDDSPHTITPVQDQDLASSCAALNATAVVSEKHCLDGKSEFPIPLSSQEIVDHVHEKMNLAREEIDGFGMSGASMKATFEYMKRYGVYTDKVYPYMGKRSPIPVIPDTALEATEKLYVRRFSLMDFSRSLLHIIREQPVVGLVDGYPSFVKYKHRDGIYKGPTVYELQMFRDKKVKPHCVQVVGIGVEEGELFFLVKNTHGETWGCSGYGKISMKLIRHFTFPNETEFAGV